ncbi:MAG: glycosyltransferase [Bacteroidia bacterium]
MIHFTSDWKFILFVIFAVSAGIQLVYYWIFFRRLAFFKSPELNGGQQPVSVIICAKNEAVRLRKYLTAILEQAYPEFEVIVVNDCSWDESTEYLEAMSKQYAHLKVVEIKEQEKYRHAKKFALTLGIKAAKHEMLLMTDADCLPASKNWLSLMQRNFVKQTEIVLGYGAYQKMPGFLNKLIRFDTFQIAIQYLSAALGKNAYMGVGRNLAYRKSVFFRSKGFAKHNHLISGDDDLFVNENATKENTVMEISHDAFTLSEPKTTFSGWFAQKRRHMSTARHYKAGHQFMLFVSSFSSFLFFTTLIALLGLRFEWRLLLSLYAGSLLLRFPIIFLSSKKLNEKDLAWMFPILEIIHTFLQPVFYISNLVTKQKPWK